MVAQWRTLAAPKRNSPSTLEGIDALISKHIAPVFDKVRIAVVTPDDIEAFLAARDYLSKSMMTKIKRILSQSWDFAMRRRYATWNPARIAEVPAGLHLPRDGRALTVSEAQALLNVADHHRNGAWVTVAMTLGLRVQETSALSWDYIDFDRGTLEVVQAFTWTKDGPELKETMGRPGVRLEHQDSALPVESAPMVELAVEAGIEGKVTPRSMRATAGSLLSHDGIALERIADLLGHRDIRTLQAHYRRPVAPSVDTATDYWKVATEVANHPKKEISGGVNRDTAKRVG